VKRFVNEEITIEQALPAPPERVFRALTLEIGSWWDHRFREGSSVGFEPRIGGRFYEDLGQGSAALYAIVSLIDPPRRLRLEGGMGMDGTLVSVMDFKLEPGSGGTKLSLVHGILGNLEPGIVDEYREGWRAILGKTLPAWLEKGGKP
jgi:uncharacterized protein YndB with AHSA1/START domain